MESIQQTLIKRKAEIAKEKTLQFNIKTKNMQNTLQQMQKNRREERKKQKEREHINYIKNRNDFAIRLKKEYNDYDSECFDQTILDKYSNNLEKQQLFQNYKQHWDFVINNSTNADEVINTIKKVKEFFCLMRTKIK